MHELEDAEGVMGAHVPAQAARSRGWPDQAKVAGGFFADLTHVLEARLH